MDHFETNSEYYNRNARRYENASWYFFNQYKKDEVVKELSVLLEAISNNGPLRVLEIGPGTGYLLSNLLTLTKRPIHYVGIEHSAAMGAILEEKYGTRCESFELFEMSASKDTVNAAAGGKKFDVVMGSSILHHIPDYAELVDALSSKVCPGGGLYIVREPLHKKECAQANFLQKVLYYILGAITKGIFKTNLHTKLYPDKVKAEPADRIGIHMFRDGVSLEPFHALEAKNFRIASLRKYNRRLTSFLSRLENSWLSKMRMDYFGDTLFAICMIKEGGSKQRLERIVSDILAKKPFSIVKLNHGFWEYRVKVEERFGIVDYDSPEPIESELDQFHQERGIKFTARFMNELKELVRSIPSMDRLSFLGSVYAWRDCLRIEKTPLCGVQRATKAMKNYLDPATVVGNGLFWKEITYDNQIHLFIDAIRTRKVVIVGPKYIAFFSEFAKLPKVDFIEISSAEAYKHRYNTLEELKKIYNVSMHIEEAPVFLFECGDLVALWFITNLQDCCPNATMIDLGQVLNLCNLAYLEDINWFVQHRDKVVTAIASINPAWIDDERSWMRTDNQKEVTTGRSFAVSEGIHPELYLAMQKHISLGRTTLPSVRYGFVENKRIDKALVLKLLSISSRQNHWSNFGPVSRALVEALSLYLSLPESRVPVVCKSGTCALYALVGLEEYKMRRKMRWAVSAFGFYSTKRGPLNDAVVVDCTPDGLISISALDNIKDEIDGVVVTNTFGMHNAWTPLIDFCKRHNLVLLYDNATALLGPNRDESNAPNEIISFHQTKPWGIGEAGVAIVDKEDVDIVTAILNFGVGGEVGIRKYSGNGKLSDYDSALLLQRLLTTPRWLPSYRLQQRRMLKIVKECGLSLLGPPNQLSNFISVLMDHPIAYDDIINDVIALNKYYLPLESGYPVANDLYARIVNVPCHPDVAAINEKDIKKVLIGLKERCHPSRPLPRDHKDNSDEVQYLFVTGCSRSGTSVMADLLRSNPLIAMGRKRYASRYYNKNFSKELYAKERFCSILKKGDSHHQQLDAYYTNLTERFDQCRFVGDKIPEISLDFETLNSAFPDCKLVYMLRNVFDIASSFNVRARATQQRGGAWPVNRNYKSAVFEWNQALEGVLNQIDKNNIFIAEYENFFNNRNYLERLFDYLGMAVSAEIDSAYMTISKEAITLENDRKIFLSSQQKKFISQNARFDLYAEVIHRIK